MNLTLLNLNYNIFQLMNSWLDTVLSPFLHNVDDGFCDFWTNPCYLFTNSCVQLSDSLGLIFLY